MKIVIIDTSYNSSLSKVEAFLDHNEESDMVCTFDAMSWEKLSISTDLSPYISSDYS